YLVHAIVTEPRDLKLAITACQQALAGREGFYPLAHESLAIAYSLAGDQRAALTEYRIAFDQFDGRCGATLENLITTLTEGEAYAALGDWPAAAGQFAAIIKSSDLSDPSAAQAFATIIMRLVRYF